MSNVLAERLQRYINNTVQLNQDEIIFLIFLIGESKNSNTKEILYSLLNDKRYRVRAAAVTALSKFDYKEKDKVFKAKFFDKIKEMINENSEYKLYNKDIALALKNFEPDYSIPLLMKMIRNDYYGVRFNASNILKITGDKAYSSYINETKSNPDNALIYLADAVIGLSNEKFREIINILLKTGSIDKGLKSNIILDVLIKKLAVSESDSLKKWIRKKIKSLEVDTNYKTR
jgi:hypothetical protein